MFTVAVSNNHHISLVFIPQLFTKTPTNLASMHKEITSNSSSGRFQATYMYNHLLPNDKIQGCDP
jgi:hypothetical protein